MADYLFMSLELRINLPSVLTKMSRKKNLAFSSIDMEVNNIMKMQTYYFWLFTTS